MAGIVGYIGENFTDKNPNLITFMSHAIQHVESNIIDQWRDKHLAIARVHHGVANPEKQPIFNEDKSLFIFMDGEVYDYETDKQFLIEKGHRFLNEKNDAEFCLHLYEELGEEAFKKLNGSFLIAIYDLRSKKLLLVNDRFSSRPLFYYASKEYFIFSAQLKAVLESDKVPRNLDRQAVIEFFSFQKVIGDKTYYQDVKVMCPATILIFRKGKTSTKQYWAMKYQEDKRKTNEYYIDALAHALSKAVKRRTSDNKNYGVLLSGGLDSRSIIAASDIQLTAFTIADYYNNEVKLASEIAKVKGYKHIYLERDPDHYPNIVEKAVELGDGMYSFYHAHFIDVLDIIKKECDVILYACSLGALFKGAYLPRWNIKLPGKTISLPVLDIPSEKNLVQTVFGKYAYSLMGREPHKLFKDDFSKSFEDSLEKSVRSNLKNSSKITKNLVNMLDYFVLYFLSKHSTYLNELCIRHCMEERLLIFDNDLFDFYLGMPPELRFNGRIYRKAVGRLNPKIGQIEDANTCLSPFVPEYIEWGITMGKRILKKIHRQKLSSPAVTQTSWPKMSELIRHNDKMKQLIWDVINDERCVDSVIFNRKVVTEMFNKHLNCQGDYTDFLFLVLTFGIWYKKYGPR